MKKRNTKNRIYNLESGVIEVYSFRPINYKLNLFRLKELNKIHKEEQILREVPTNGWFTPKKRVIFECGAYVLQGMNLSKFKDIDKHSLLRKLYINGAFSGDSVDVHPDLITLKLNQGFDNYRIQLTNDAYVGHLLENEEFDAGILRISNLDKHRELFNVSEEPQLVISLDEVEKMYESELIPGTFDDTLTYLDRSSKVYKKIKPLK